MPSPLLVPLLSAGIPALGSLLGSLVGKKSQDDTNEANMELAKFQYDKNLEMWNLQSEYNKPVNQRMRLIEAGLNPALMYGSGKVANVAGPAPEYKAPTLQAYTNYGDFGFTAAYNGYLAAKKQAAEIDNINQNTQNLATQNEINEIDKDRHTLDVIAARIANSKSEIELKYWEDMQKETLRRITAEIVERTSHGLAYDAQAGYLGAQQKTEDALRPQRVKNEEKRGTVLDTEASKNRQIEATEKAHAGAYAAQRDLYNQQSKVASQQAAKLAAETFDLTYRQKDRLEYQLNKLANDVRIGNVDANRKELEYRLKKVVEDTGIDPNAPGYWGWFDKVVWTLTKEVEFWSDYFSE